MHPDDVRLMERVKRDDADAFERLFRKYERKVLNFFHKICFSQTLAEDLTQETFVRLWFSRHSYRPDAGRFSTYLFQIAKNCWYSLSRSDRRRAEAKKAEIEEAAAGGRSDDPLRRVESAELHAEVRAAVAALPEESRIPFVLSRYTGLKYDEIAQILSVSLRTVERRIGEAVRLLAERLVGK